MNKNIFKESSTYTKTHTPLKKTHTQRRTNTLHTHTHTYTHTNELVHLHVSTRTLKSFVDKDLEVPNDLASGWTNNWRLKNVTSVTMQIREQSVSNLHKQVLASQESNKFMVSRM